MQISKIKIKDITPYKNNSRTHSSEQITQISKSIEEFGFNNPILIDENKGVIAGHGRLLAAQELGFEEVPTIELKHLSDNQRKAYIIADNKLALNANWNMDLLKSELQSLNAENIDLSIIGFKNGELDNFIFSEDVEEAYLNEEIEMQEETINDVRMIQLFYDVENENILRQKIKIISEKYNLDNISDAILKGLEIATSMDNVDENS